ncbi:MAG: endolytic transglycosylase MltG [Chloroflexota bacterium]
MPLQADPTVQYALGYQADTQSWWKSPLALADLEIDSPYNTYQNNGLPPGPISNPSRASLEAVANPAVTDYLFFVLDCTADQPGAHVFQHDV